MVKVIFFDTETTGLPKNRNICPLSQKDNWPDLVSISYKVYNFDGNNKSLIKKIDKIIKPNGWNIPLESVKFHKITQQIAEENGNELSNVIKEFIEDIKDTYLIIAHNLEFDKNVIINVGFWRLGINIKDIWPTEAEFCSYKEYKEEGMKDKKHDLNSLYFDTFKRSAPENAHTASRDVDVLDNIFWQRWNPILETELNNNIIQNSNDDKLISFGKHIGKSYKYMIENQKSYCMYVLNQEDCKGSFKDFQDYLKQHNKIYNIDDLRKKYSINCSELAKYMNCDNKITNLINNIKINIKNVNKIKSNKDINPRLFGQFIDYLIRYEISKLLSNKFKDNRTETIIKGNGFYTLGTLDEEGDKLQNILVEELRMNIWDIKNVNDVIESILKVSNYNSMEIIDIINRYQNKIKEFQPIKDSYTKIQNNNNVILSDILNISISHSLFFCNNKDTEYINYTKEIINKKSHSNIIEYLKEKISNKNNILLNPTLGNSNLHIMADADIIIDNEIIDIKISNSIGLNINDFIQLIVYAVLYYENNNILCNKLTIYNPIIGKELSIEINLDLINKFSKNIKEYKIGEFRKI